MASMQERMWAWAQQSGLTSFVRMGMGTRARGEEEEGNSAWQSEGFSSRIDMVQKHLNLPIRPVLLCRSDLMEGPKAVLRDAYRQESLFLWLRGHARSEQSEERKSEELMEWFIDWRITNCWRYSHCLAIPHRSSSSSSSDAASLYRGCAIVTYPGSKQDIDKLILLLNTGCTPPPSLGSQCKKRFAALEHMWAARDRLAGQGPHWYVHMIGVAASEQGRGVGRMLMRIICALADQDALPVHLEVSGSRNRAFFEQCGFRAMQTVDLSSDDSPTLKIHLMTRIPFPKNIELV